MPTRPLKVRRNQRIPLRASGSARNLSKIFTDQQTSAGLQIIQFKQGCMIDRRLQAGLQELKLGSNWNRKSVIYTWSLEMYSVGSLSGMEGTSSISCGGTTSPISNLSKLRP